MFYRCPHCGNIVFFVNNSGAPITCCGEKMVALAPNTSDGAGEKHVPMITMKEGDKESEWKVKVEVGEVEHPMTEEHYIQWIALETKSGVQVKHLNPGDKPKAKFVAVKDEVIAAYEYCNLHGLWKRDM